jgi:hypothetical protein
VPKDVHLCFEALSQTKIVRPQLEPAFWTLKEVKASTNFYGPTVVEPDFSIMNVVLNRNIQFVLTRSQRHGRPLSSALRVKGAVKHALRLRDNRLFIIPLRV